MNAKPICRLSRALRHAVVPVAALCCWLLGTVSVEGQQSQAPTGKASPPKETRRTEQDEQQFQVFALRDTYANQAKDVLLQVIGRASDVSVGADERTNRLIVRAAADTMKTIESVIKALDTPAPEKHTDQRAETKIFRLRTKPDQGLEKALEIVLSDQNQGRFAMDHVRNLVVVHGASNTVALLESVIREFDESHPIRPESPGVQVRIVWLISGAEGAPLAEVPADLNGAVADLKKIGVEGLRLAAQTVVKTVPGNRFQVRCTPMLQNPTDLSIEGVYVDGEGDRSGLQILVNAMDKPPTGFGGGGGVRQLCNLETKVIAPAGHTVVLGVTPVGTMTSVFVIQVAASE